MPPSLFRDAMARLGAAVAVVTSDGPAGRCGLTASALCSVTDAPPTVLVCVNRGSALNPVMRANGVIGINLLGAGDAALSDTFAGRTGLPMADRFDARWGRGETGVPLLRGAAAALEGRIADVVERGTHSLLLVELSRIELGPGEVGGLVWFSRAYHGLRAA
ncbi:flavin reductase [Plastoroseomonas hellenica]|nr:flavin reductase [Plastoroseomonas hellenica]